jgi:peptidoglycan/xylan/chitin deacetylase (PgdA/CDA1 family)
VVLPLLTFHTIQDGPAPIAFPRGIFCDGMKRLHAHGYRALSVPEGVAGARGHLPVPARSVAITFDDGYRSVYEVAFPVLQQYGLVATVFLTVGAETTQTRGDRLPPSGGRAMLSWPEIREMQRHGFVFGAHTCSHPDLTRLPRDQVEAEISGSKAIIEDALGVPVSCFAYPYGRYDRRVAEIVRTHFACACSTRLGLMTERSDPYALERVDAHYLRHPRRFALIGSRLFPWYLSIYRLPRAIRETLSPRGTARLDM